MNYKKDQRKCVAENENELMFYKQYSQINCHEEVLALQAAEKCGCAVFWMPRLNETQICGFYKDIGCVIDVYQSTEDVDLKNKCLPSCNNIR